MLLTHSSLATVTLVLLLVPDSVVARDADPFDAESAFTQLRQLAGTWTGIYGDQAAGMDFEVTSAGHTVEQTLFPGEHHEMKTLFYLDDGGLVGQHYCMLGNQPRFRFVPSDEPGLIRLRFDGGTNLDPDKDYHAHEGLFRLMQDGSLESTWTFFENGEAKERRTFRLQRTAGE